MASVTLDGLLTPSLEHLNPEYKQLLTYIIPKGEKVLFKNNFHHYVIKKLKSVSIQNVTVTDTQFLQPLAISLHAPAEYTNPILSVLLYTQGR